MPAKPPLTAEDILNKYNGYLSDSSAWCDQVREKQKAYNEMAARAPASVPSAADVVVQALQGKQYVDPDMIASVLAERVDVLGCEIGDPVCLEKAKREKAKHEEYAAETALRDAGKQACLASSRGEIGALSAILDEYPSLAKECKDHLLPFSSSSGLRGLEDDHCYGKHTLLTLACEHCHFECAELILRHGADANHALDYSTHHRGERISHTYYPLHLVLKFDGHSATGPDASGSLGPSRLSLVRSLVNHRADTRKTASHFSGGSHGRDDGATVLHLAAEQASHGAEIVFALLEEEFRKEGASSQVSALEATNRAGRTPLVCVGGANSGGCVKTATALMDGWIAAKLSLDQQKDGEDELKKQLLSLQKAATSTLQSINQYKHLNEEGRPARRFKSLIEMLEVKVGPCKTEVAGYPASAARQPPVKVIRGTHLGSGCACRPGPDEACWGYRDSVKTTCPQCQKIIKADPRTVTEDCRHNGDAYGWIYLTCESCGLVQKEGWDEA